MFGYTIYIGITAIIINIAIAVILTLVLKAFKVPEGPDETLPHQYTVDPEESRPPGARRDRGAVGGLRRAAAVRTNALKAFYPGGPELAPGPSPNSLRGGNVCLVTLFPGTRARTPSRSPSGTA